MTGSGGGGVGYDWYSSSGDGDYGFFGDRYCENIAVISLAWSGGDGTEVEKLMMVMV